MSVCFWLVNLQPVLILLFTDYEDTDEVEEYFQFPYSSDTEYDADRCT